MRAKQTLKARRLVLVDDDGKERIVLDASWPKGFASIDLFSPSGAAWKFWVDRDGIPKAAVQRPDSRFAVTFALQPEGEPVLVFYDAAGLPMVRLGVGGGDPTPRVEVLRDGKVVWSSSKQTRRRG